MINKIITLEEIRQLKGLDLVQARSDYKKWREGRRKLDRQEWTRDNNMHWKAKQYFHRIGVTDINKYIEGFEKFGKIKESQ